MPTGDHSGDFRNGGYKKQIQTEMGEPVITNKVSQAVSEWQNRPLESLHMIAWMDGIVFEPDFWLAISMDLPIIYYLRFAFPPIWFILTIACNMK